MEAAASLNRLFPAAKHTLGDLRVINALEQSKRSLSAQGSTVYTHSRECALCRARLNRTESYCAQDRSQLCILRGWETMVKV